MFSLTRKIYRLSGLSFPILYYLTDKRITLIALFSITCIFLLIEFLRFRKSDFNKKLFRYFKNFFKSKEKKRLSGSTNFLIACCLVISFFNKEIAITVMVLSLLGDEAAAIAGVAFGKTKFRNKSLEGSLGCLLVCLAMGGLLKSVFNLDISIWQVFMASFFISLFEFLPLPLDDNLILPLIGAISMYLLTI